MRKAHKGDKIACMGIVVTIEKVLFADIFEGCWDIELIDTAGNYRHWKQEYDGGRLFPKRKVAYDWYGQDCTDLYIKYGQPI